MVKSGGKKAQPVYVTKLLKKQRNHKEFSPRWGIHAKGAKAGMREGNCLDSQIRKFILDNPDLNRPPCFINIASHHINNVRSFYQHIKSWRIVRMTPQVTVSNNTIASRPDVSAVDSDNRRIFIEIKHTNYTAAQFKIIRSRVCQNRSKLLNGLQNNIMTAYNYQASLPALLTPGSIARIMVFCRGSVLVWDPDPAVYNNVDLYVIPTTKTVQQARIRAAPPTKRKSVTRLECSNHTAAYLNELNWKVVCSTENLHIIGNNSDNFNAIFSPRIFKRTLVKRASWMEDVIREYRGVYRNISDPVIGYVKQSESGIIVVCEFPKTALVDGVHN